MCGDGREVLRSGRRRSFCWGAIVSVWRAVRTEMEVVVVKARESCDAMEMVAEMNGGSRSGERR